MENDFPVREELTISADIISEEVCDYMIHRNLSMHVPYMDEREVLILRTVHAIERHIDMVGNAEYDDFKLSTPTLGNKLCRLFNGSLDNYKADAIKFDDIIELVHAIFQGNWGIEVKLIQSTVFPEIWNAKYVGFVKDDPIK